MNQQEEAQRQDFLMRRARAPPTNAAVFMETNTSVSSKLSDPMSVYIDSLDHFGSVDEAKKQDQINIELWKQANMEIDKLFALIDQVRAKMDKKSPGSLQQPARLDLRRCTWDQVMGEVHSAATRWSTTPKKSSKIMNCLDKLGQNSAAFKSWLELLPAGDYGSSICGVFTVAVGAVGAFAKVETVIVETLAEIPEVMDDARKYIKIYSRCRDQILEKRTFELYLSILKTLTHVMQFFADSSLRKVYQPVLKQSSYKSELLASCEDIKSRASRVKNEANICMQKRTVDMDQTIHDTNGKMDRALGYMENFYRLLLSSEARFKPGSGEYDYNGQTTQAMPTMRQAIKDQKSDDNTHERNIERAKDLLEALKYDPDVVLTDTETCLCLGNLMGENSRARASALIGSPMFKAFMTENASSGPLLVNGNEDLSSAEGLSPLSLVAARLAHISEQNESRRGITLRYFCAEHGPYAGANQTSSPAGRMMISLTGQLITHMLSRSVEADLSFLKLNQWAALKNENLRVVCTVFYELVKQIPSNTVLLCILDEVALYETGMAQQDLDAVVRRLTRLVEGTDDIVFKMLVTCRGRAMDTGQYFAGHTLELDEDVEADDSSTWQIASMG